MKYLVNLKYMILPHIVMVGALLMDYLVYNPGTHPHTLVKWLWAVITIGSIVMGTYGQDIEDECDDTVKDPILVCAVAMVILFIMLGVGHAAVGKNS